MKERGERGGERERKGGLRASEIEGENVGEGVKDGWKNTRKNKKWKERKIMWFWVKENRKSLKRGKQNVEREKGIERGKVQRKRERERERKREQWKERKRNLSRKRERCSNVF